MRFRETDRCCGDEVDESGTWDLERRINGVDSSSGSKSSRSLRSGDGEMSLCGSVSWRREGWRGRFLNDSAGYAFTALGNPDPRGPLLTFIATSTLLSLVNRNSSATAFTPCDDGTCTSTSSLLTSLSLSPTLLATSIALARSASLTTRANSALCFPLTGLRRIVPISLCASAPLIVGALLRLSTSCRLLSFLSVLTKPSLSSLGIVPRPEED